MKQILVMMAAVVVLGQSVVGDEKLITDPLVEKVVRSRINKFKGELTKADLEKVTRLDLFDIQLTDLKGLEKLTRLTELDLIDNPGLTKAQIVELQKALPNCKIRSNPTN